MPTAVSVFGGERVPFPKPPRELAERFFTLTGWQEHDRGGHFPAVAEPRLLAGILRDTFRPLRELCQGTMPDIAADGDLDSGILTGYIASGTDAHPGPYQTEESAGTSLATPLVAGLVADALQGQGSAFGFINPLIYRLAGTPVFHDILPVTASMPQQDRDAWEPPSEGLCPALDVFDSQERACTQQVTAKGYDTMTGVGTPNGAAFITRLRRAADCFH